MTPSAILWAASAALAVGGGLLRLVLRRRVATTGREAGPRMAAPCLFVLLPALLGAAAGVGWRAWEARAWPGLAGADALALLAGGSLLVLAWNEAVRWRRHTACTAHAWVALAAAGALLAAAAALAPGQPAPALELPLRTWPFGMRNLFAAIGLGGWIPAAAASSLSALRRLAAPAPAGAAAFARNEPGQTSSATVMSLEGVLAGADPGRPAALTSYPWLTLACLVAGLWNLVAYATAGRAVAGDLWLLAAWLLGAVYLHLTSGWRPLPRVAAWLAPLSAAAVLAAGILAALGAGSLR